MVQRKIKQFNYPMSENSFEVFKTCYSKTQRDMKNPISFDDSAAEADADP